MARVCHILIIAIAKLALKFLVLAAYVKLYALRWYCNEEKEEEERKDEGTANTWGRTLRSNE